MYYNVLRVACLLVCVPKVCRQGLFTKGRARPATGGKWDHLYNIALPVIIWVMLFCFPAQFAIYYDKVIDKDFLIHEH